MATGRGRGHVEVTLVFTYMPERRLLMQYQCSFRGCGGGDGARLGIGYRNGDVANAVDGSSCNEVMDWIRSSCVKVLL